MSTGTEALDGGAPKKQASKARHSGAKPKRQIHHIISRPHKDGTVGHTHVYAGKDGHPDYAAAPEEYSSASADDAGAHVAQTLGGGGDPDQAAAPAQGADPAAAQAAAAPAQGADPAAAVAAAGA